MVDEKNAGLRIDSDPRNGEERSDMNVTIRSGKYSCVISYHGAELKSFKKDNTEYIFQADPEFWPRSSPVLFPIVGALNNKKIKIGGKEYSMSQHGFARDTDFKLLEKNESSCIFYLRSSEETKKLYPFDFELRIEYVLKKSRLTISWRVINIGAETMYFSIGAHPAFCCEPCNASVRLFKDGRRLESFENLEYAAGTLSGKTSTVKLDDGKLLYEHHTFDKDAYVLGDRQADEAELLDGKGKRLVTVRFETPALGIWSPTAKDAPFICIEPWYGLPDPIGFEGEFSEKPLSLACEPGGKSEKSYTIEIY